MTVWALIPCSASKQKAACPAREMYSPSQQFSGAWAAAMAAGQRPLILSAKHGVLDPDTVIEPYDQTLQGARKAVKLAWSAGVLNSLVDIIDASSDRVVSYLGRDYGDFLLPDLRALGIPVDEPMVDSEGRRLSQGGRLKRFKELLAEQR